MCFWRQSSGTVTNSTGALGMFTRLVNGLPFVLLEVVIRYCHQNYRSIVLLEMANRPSQ